MPSNNETAGRSLLADVEAPASDLFTRHGYRKHHEGHKYHPKTVLRVVTRIQALTLELLPIQVDLGAVLLVLHPGSVPRAEKARSSF